MSHEKTIEELSWRYYCKIVIESMLAIYIASFCVGVFVIHRGASWLIPGIILGMLYAFVFVVSVKRIISELPMAGIMIAAPTVPLVILIMFLSLLPVLQWLQ